MPRDIPFHPVVDGDHVRGALACSVRGNKNRGRPATPDATRWAKAGPERGEPFVPFRVGLGHDFANEVAADQVGTGLSLLDQGGIVEFGRGNDARHGALDANAADEGPRVDPLQANHLVLRK